MSNTLDRCVSLGELRVRQDDDELLASVAGDDIEDRQREAALVASRPSARRRARGQAWRRGSSSAFRTLVDRRTGVSLAAGYSDQLRTLADALTISETRRGSRDRKRRAREIAAQQPERNNRHPVPLRSLRPRTPGGSPCVSGRRDPAGNRASRRLAGRCVPRRFSRPIRRCRERGRESPSRRGGAKRAAGSLAGRRVPNRR